MSKLKTLVLSGSILAALGLSTGALMLAYLNRPIKPSDVHLAAPDLAVVVGYKPNAKQGDRVVVLTSSNAAFDWTCGKANLAGVRAEEHIGHWDNLGGAVAYNAKANKVLAMEVVFATDSLQSDNNTLTNTVRDQQWFDTEKYPKATFSATTFLPKSAATEKTVAEKKLVAPTGWTHLIQGTFSLNGISQELTIPAQIVFTGESARIEAQFPISRQAFNVKPHKLSLAAAGAAMFTVDDVVNIHTRIVASPDLASLVKELSTQLQAQQTAMHNAEETQGKKIKALQNDLMNLSSKMEEQMAELKKIAAAGASAAPAPVVDVSKLPKTFEDALVLPPLEKDYELKNQATGKMEKKHQSYSGMKENFKMVLVPGDPAKGITPFYMGESEVTWDMFRPWSHWFDVTILDAQDELNQGIRPSNADSYADTSHNDKRYGKFPALGMSRLNAEKFCTLLSQKTGRKYRLPTEAEWDLAYALGGGDPADKLAYAVCKENAEQTPESFEDCPSEVKSKKPNSLGIYDMLGNVAEWVKTKGALDADGKNTFVRGGDFKTPLAELTGKRREESINQRGHAGDWNQNYPNDPVSPWWFKDHYQIGFRLVCEPVNIPASIPAK